MNASASNTNTGSIATANAELGLYLSPRDLAGRWRCSRTCAQDIARREGFTRVMLGHGKNGIVRYLRDEIEAYEASRTVRSAN